MALAQNDATAAAPTALRTCSAHRAPRWEKKKASAPEQTLGAPEAQVTKGFAEPAHNANPLTYVKGGVPGAPSRGAKRAVDDRRGRDDAHRAVRWLELC